MSAGLSGHTVPRCPLRPACDGEPPFSPLRPSWLPWGEAVPAAPLHGRSGHWAGGGQQRGCPPFLNQSCHQHSASVVTSTSAQPQQQEGPCPSRGPVQQEEGIGPQRGLRPEVARPGPGPAAGSGAVLGAAAPPASVGDTLALQSRGWWGAPGRVWGSRPPRESRLSAARGGLAQGGSRVGRSCRGARWPLGTLPLTRPSAQDTPSSTWGQLGWRVGRAVLAHTCVHRPALPQHLSLRRRVGGEVERTLGVGGWAYVGNGCL